MYGAVDIGGSKTLFVIFDNKGKLVTKIKFETPIKYQDFLEELEKSYNKLGSPSLDITCVALPGKIDRSKGIGIAFGNLGWINIPARKDFEKTLRCPILLENDAKLAGLYEANQLKDKNFKKVFYLTVSTGIGGGLIINNKISKDFEDIEPGLMLLEHQGKLEKWQDFASGKAIYLKFHQKASEITDTKIWYQVAHNIALGLIDIIAMINPDIVIIGGGVGAHLEKFQDRLIEDLKVYQNPLITIPTIVKAKDAEEAVVYGCFLKAKSYVDKNN
jgi:glucokinase